MRKKERTPYRPDQAVHLARIEARRQRLGIKHQDLADAADISIATYRRIRKSGRAALPQIVKLRFALRTIAQRRRAGDMMFEAADV
ncbi:hypothetical protein ACRQ1B_06150 [Rhizobium panacihumi]|uniref:hypothetical protein n=1 Tax=Rhizobium panacihumi TaxID=2008450 RepID=UPI003D7AA504